MTKARTISQYLVYSSNVENYAVTYDKLTDQGLQEDWGSVADATIDSQEDYGTL